MNKTITYRVGSLKMDYAGVIDLLNEIMNLTLEKTTEDINDWVLTYIAKRTGQLQDSILDNLLLSGWLNKKLTILLKTDVEYAKDVNEMENEHVQHLNEIGFANYYGHNGMIILNDPKAIGNFWPHLVKYSIDMLKDNFNRSKFEKCGGVGVSGTSTNKILGSEAIL